jgi:hypothetical protein
MLSAVAGSFDDYPGGASSVLYKEPARWECRPAIFSRNRFVSQAGGVSPVFYFPFSTLWISRVVLLLVPYGFFEAVSKVACIWAQQIKLERRGAKAQRTKYSSAPPRSIIWVIVIENFF